MPNNDYKTNYEDTAIGVSTINNNSESINEIVKKTDQNIKNTLDSDMFSGPLADYAQNTWDAIRTIADKNSNNIATSGRSLNTINETYQESDDNAREELGKV